MWERLRVLAAVLRSPVLRRVVLAFLAFSIAEWATWVAIVVVAYRRGGAAEAGLVAFVALAPSLVVAPLGSALGDRYPRTVVLVGSYAFQASAMLAVAIALVTGLAPIPTYALAAISATSIALTRPLHASLLPELVTTPDALTAANVASGTAESAGTLAGPLVASALIAVGGPAAVYAGSGVVLLVMAGTLVPLAVTALGVAPVARAGDPVGRPQLAVIRRELGAGLAAIVGDRRLLAVAVAQAAAWLLLGALDILYAVLAIDVLDMGEVGVGVLGAATGAGMLAGSAVAVGLVGRPRLAPPLVAAASIFGIAVAAIALVAAPETAGAPAAVAGMLVVAGCAYVVLYVSGQTLAQRLAPPAALSRVFGVFEATLMGMTALGALCVPLLVALAGPSGALVVAGLLLPVIGLLVLGPLRTADAALRVPVRELRVLAAVPMLAALSAPVLERLARAAMPVRVAIGAAVIREGEPGDRFYVIVGGRVAVSIAGRPVREQGPGDSFGEIALLRPVPRTATVTAIEPTELLALECEPFLEAVTGQRRSHALATALVEERMATTG
jgi:MFS family permease